MTIPLYFHSLVHSEEEMDMFCDLTMLAFFPLDTVRTRSFKLCMIIDLLGFHCFIPLPGLMTLFQGQRHVWKENFKLSFLKIVVQCSFKIVWWLHTGKIMHSILCMTGLCLMEIKFCVHGFFVCVLLFFCCFCFSSFLGLCYSLKGSCTVLFAWLVCI